MNDRTNQQGENSKQAPACTLQPIVRHKLFRSVDVVRMDIVGKLTVFCPADYRHGRMKRVSKPKDEPVIYYCKKCNKAWELQ